MDEPFKFWKSEFKGKGHNRHIWKMIETKSLSASPSDLADILTMRKGKKPIYFVHSKKCNVRLPYVKHT